MARLKSIFGAIIVLLALASCTTEPRYQPMPVPCLPAAPVVRTDGVTACLATCRKDLVNVLDRCYRNPENFVSNQQTTSGRAQYLQNVATCITSTGKFSTYKPGVEMCESICGKYSLPTPPY